MTDVTSFKVARYNQRYSPEAYEAQLFFQDGKYASAYMRMLKVFQCFKVKNKEIVFLNIVKGLEYLSQYLREIKKEEQHRNKKEEAKKINGAIDSIHEAYQCAKKNLPETDAGVKGTKKTFKMEKETQQMVIAEVEFFIAVLAKIMKQDNLVQMYVEASSSIFVLNGKKEITEKDIDAFIKKLEKNS